MKRANARMLKPRPSAISTSGGRSTTASVESDVWFSSSPHHSAAPLVGRLNRFTCRSHLHNVASASGLSCTSSREAHCSLVTKGATALGRADSGLCVHRSVRLSFGALVFKISAALRHGCGSVLSVRGFAPARLPKLARSSLTPFLLFSSLSTTSGSQRCRRQDHRPRRSQPPG